MQVDRSKWFRPLRIVWMAALVLMLALPALGGCARSGGSKGGNESRLVLLAGCNPSKVWVIDPARRRVVSTVKLRSNAVLCDVDPMSGAVVTGQCGGLEWETDDVAGIVDARSSRPRYVQLKTPNPVDVAVLDGVAVVLHGFERREGVVASSLEVKSGSLLAESFMPPYPQRIGRSGNAILMTSEPPSESRETSGAALYTVEPRTLQAEKICDLGLTSAAPIADDRSTPAMPTVLVVGFSDTSSPRARAASSEILRVDLRSKEVIERLELRDLKAGAFEASVSGRTLAVLDAASGEPASHDAVAIFDYPSGEPLARVASGSPADVVVAGDEVHVVDMEAGAVKHYSIDGRLRGMTEIGDLGVTADLHAVGHR